MAFKLAELFVEIKAKTAKFKGAMAGMRKSLGRMNVNLDALARKAKIAFMIVGAAAAAAAVFVVKAAVKQRDAEFMLAAALKATGHQAELYMGNLKAAAVQIQKNTIYGDEFVLDLMAQGLNLGVTGDKIEGATKSAIGLAIALKMDLQTSMRYATLAMQGEFTMLRRYIPALRKTEDAVKQLAIIQKVAAGGYEQAEAYTKTARGQYEQLKNEIGDTAETIGDALIPALNSVLAALKKFMVFVRARIELWAESWAWAIYLITNWQDTTKLAFLTVQNALADFVDDWSSRWDAVTSKTKSSAKELSIAWVKMKEDIARDIKKKGFWATLHQELGVAATEGQRLGFGAGRRRSADDASAGDGMVGAAGSLLDKLKVFWDSIAPKGRTPEQQARDDALDAIQRKIGEDFAAFWEKMKGGIDKISGMPGLGDPADGLGGKGKGKGAAFTGLAEAWKKIQLGVADLPAERTANATERSLTVLKVIAANTRGPQGGIRDQSGITRHPLFSPNLILTDKNEWH